MPQGDNGQILPGQARLQCVPYVRDHSTVKLWGDAWTWWDQAAGKYERGRTPIHGAVLVLHNYAGLRQGHVAVVRQRVSDREIRIDHANWLNDGAIFLNNPVLDVSPANDWSQVRVFNIRTGSWGTRIYPVKGFIGTGSAAPAQTPPTELDLLLARIEADTPPPAPLPGSDSSQSGPPPASSYALTAEDLAIP